MAKVSVIGAGSWGTALALLLYKAGCARQFDSKLSLRSLALFLNLFISLVPYYCYDISGLPS